MAHLRTTETSLPAGLVADRAPAIVLVENDALRHWLVDALNRIGCECFQHPVAGTVVDPEIRVAFIDAAYLSTRSASSMLSTLRGGEHAAPVIGVVAHPASPDVDSLIDRGIEELLIVPQELDTLELRLSIVERRRNRSRASNLFGTDRDLKLLAAAERQAQELKLLHEIRTAMAIDFDLSTLFRTIVQQVSAAFGYTHVSLYRLDEETLVLQHQIGYQEEFLRIPIDRGVAGRVARTGEFALIEDVRADPDFLAAVPDLTSEICVPFFLSGKVAGIVNVESVGEQHLGPDDLRLLTEITGYLNLAVERSALHSAVRASEQHLRLAVDAADMGTWVWNPATGEVNWSEQMGPLYGLPTGTKNLSSEEWFLLIHPDDRDVVRNADRQFIRFGNDYEIEFRVILPSGAIRWLEGKGRVIERGTDGEISAIAGVTMDITGRKRLEEERLRLVQLEVERVKAKEAQQLITDTLERMTAAFVAVDRNWRFTYLNRHAIAMLQPATTELAGAEIWEVFPEIRGTEIEVLLEHAASSQVVANYDMPWPGRDQWIEMHIYPAQDGLSIYLQDATERRRSEEEHRKSEARFRSLVQNASDLIVIIARDGTVRYASPAVERVIGQTPEEVVGSDNFSLAHPQDAKRLRRAFVKVAKSPGVSTLSLLRFRHRNGSYRWLEVTATNLFDDPTIQGIVANCRDVTDRHEAEHNLWFLAETSALLGTSLDLETTLSSIARLVVMNLADLCVVDVVGEGGEAEAFAVSHRNASEERRLTACRREWPLHSDSESEPGHVLRSGHSVWHETIDPESQRLWLHASGQQSDAVELGFRSAVIVPLIARGITTGVLTVASMTAGRFGAGQLSLIEELARRAALAVDNARLYRAAHAAIAARDEFLSVAAHELRTPITAITGFATLLEREVANRNDPARVERFVHRMTDAGTRLALLVDDMLDVSRIRLGQLPLRVEQVDLVALIERVMSRYEEQDPAPPHTFSFRVSETTCIVPADEDRLEQVLSNVIDNAVKYSPKGGQISITLEADHDGFLIRISDRGIGLPINDVESIFNPFGRGSNVAISSLPGMGIGLFICRNIIERHRGRIWAESAGDGQGSTFSIWLPATDPLGDLPSTE